MGLMILMSHKLNSKLDAKNLHTFVSLIRFYVESDLMGESITKEPEFEDIEQMVKLMKDDPELEQEFKRLTDQYRQYMVDDSKVSIDDVELLELC